ncbi:MAG: hypothetical protein R6V85_04520 [Polyangia bacterium]
MHQAVEQASIHPFRGPDLAPEESTLRIWPARNRGAEKEDGSLKKETGFPVPPNPVLRARLGIPPDSPAARILATALTLLAVAAVLAAGLYLVGADIESAASPEQSAPAVASEPAGEPQQQQPAVNPTPPGFSNAALPLPVDPIATNDFAPKTEQRPKRAAPAKESEKARPAKRRAKAGRANSGAVEKTAETPEKSSPIKKNPYAGKKHPASATAAENNDPIGNNPY